ncbi:MAG: ABC transporter ATP-binding protein [Eubacterium sp.]|nr:ABC transporter ATP-binding protein [Eubacterium sp.]
MQIILENVSAGYEKNNFIINDISVCLNEGGITGILGPNGSGKTTLLRVLAGVLPYEGSIRIENDSRKLEISDASRQELSRYISVLPQFSSAYFSYTVYDTVLMGRYVHRKGLFNSTSSEDKAVTEEALKLTGLSDIQDKDLGSLSGGQLQRVLLARTIAQKTPIMLLDEPMNHLDLKFQNELLEFLETWSTGSTEVLGTEYKNTVISIFHDINIASQVSDSVLIMKDGSLIKEGPAEKNLTQDLLCNVFETDISRFIVR